MVHLIKHANFQLFRAYHDEVIWKKMTGDDQDVKKRVQLFTYQTILSSKQCVKKSIRTL